MKVNPWVIRRHEVCPSPGLRCKIVAMPDPMKLTSRFDEALLFAVRQHQSQFRKGTRIPYVAHLLSVAALVLEDGGDEDEAIAALLHDAVEDQGGAAMRAEIAGRFGERIATIVDGCTDA